MTNEKILNFNEMEEIVGGSDYCDTLAMWYVHDQPGFQGDWGMLNKMWFRYCNDAWVNNN